MEPHELIKTPCSENWNCMSGDEQKRYCDKCQHHVHDLTGLTLEEIDLLHAKQKGRLCGMFRLGASTALGASILSLAACHPTNNDSIVVGEYIPPAKEAPVKHTQPAPKEEKVTKTTEEKPELKIEPELKEEKAPPIDRPMIMGMICPPPQPGRID
ncbi:hypothetical protein SAMN02745181_2595 [Rubritalea squalenifaciens DSM 18772]|uniref:Uncharacterized protein n=1 Tax=Rubritalea squalenifaciens DSM 18772 TaxID=1123071 RepID=A0A1M6M3U9_9BACT|nr:hypothetical protein [Rubritalea squalenifaciens]SHJ78174.1 hypothetical protein SAMN02745181_2595 [Rubritalea squalenifaciens DSM 18772]